MQRRPQPDAALEDFRSPHATQFIALSHGSHNELNDSSASVAMLQESPLSGAPIAMLDRKRTTSSSAPFGFDASHHDIDGDEPFAEPGPRGAPAPITISVARIPTQAPHGHHPPLSASRLARATQRMDLQELHHLRDHLAKSSVHLSGDFSRSNATSGKWSIPPSDRPTMGPLGMSQLSSMHSVRPSHRPPPTSNGFGQSFFDVTMGPGSGMYASGFGASRFQEDGERPTILTATGRLPHESVAIIIDAVRGSVLQGDDKCRFLFELFDADHKGMLSRDGVADFIDATLLASRLQLFGDVQVHDLVDKIFKGTANPHKMTYREFCEAFGPVLDDPAASRVRETKASAKPSGLAASGLHTQVQKTWQAPFTQVSDAWEKFTKSCRKHDAEIFYVCLYFLIMIGAFLIKAHYVKWDPAVGYCPKIAKGFAQIVMVNTLFLLLPMCRNFVAFLRRFAAISSRVPVDQNIEFHKICGVTMLLASLAHTVAWVFIVYYLRTASEEVWKSSRFSHLTFVREQSIFGLLPRIPIWTGVVMVLIGAIAGPLTHSRIRRGNFNAFWMTHLFFVPFLVLIVVHGLAQWVQPPQAFYWVLPPLLLYAVEKRYRVANVFGGQTSITRVRFSQGTAAIYMEKPEGFHYHPGMYLFLNVPAVSRFEWHPFTISSAPEDDFVSVHIRNAGDWTNALHETLRKVQEENKNGEVENYLPTAATDIVDASISGSTSPRLLETSPYPPVFIDGPVGAPSQDYYRYESVVFVGAGIGVTPFASILQSIMHQWEAFRCDRCENVKLPKTFKLKKIYFYWITREQEALTWFAETMNQLSAMDTEGRLEIHNYYSPLKEKAVIEPLHALQKLIHDMDGQDIISGLNTRQLTHFGRPDWKKELKRIASQQDTSLVGLNGNMKKHRVGIFFCGPKPLGNQIHSDCATFNQDEARSSPNVLFDFHSENF